MSYLNYLDDISSDIREAENFPDIPNDKKLKLDRFFFKSAIDKHGNPLIKNFGGISYCPPKYSLRKYLQLRCLNKMGNSS